MTKEQISAVLEKVREWPEPDQEELAEAAREIAARRTGIYLMTYEERQAVDRAKQSALASPDEVAAFWKRHNIP
jgi:hypothetical protein